MDKEISSEEKLLKHIRKKNPQKVREASQGSQDHTKRFVFFNRMFVYTILILSIYIIYEIFYNSKDIQEVVNRHGVVEAFVPQEQSTLKPFGHYRSKIEQRDIFQPVGENVPEETNTNVEEEKAEHLNTFVKRLRLVGIVLDDIPEAIIEDKKIQQTFFLNQGDLIEDVVVEEIHEGKVVLNYQGITTELVQ